jgi:aspartate ammonia-lyase
MSVTLKKDLRGLEDAAVAFSEVNMGGTAIGTGINTVSAGMHKGNSFAMPSCVLTTMLFYCTF